MSAASTAAPGALNPPHGASPPAEFAIDFKLVRQLLSEQCPQYADLALRPLDSGWDNMMFRLGTDLTVRVPRRRVADALMQHEQRWLPRLQPRLPLPIPVPIHCGVPSARFPLHWSVLPWLPGATANRAIPDRNQAKVLGEFLNRLHQPAPADLPLNPARGVPLSHKRAAAAERIAKLAQTNLLDRRLLAVWERALEVTPASGLTWIHGDLHARNILVEHGQLSAVIDWGDISRGDRAVDYASLWSVIDDRRARQACLEQLGDVEAEARSRGWAFFMGLVLAHTGRVDHSEHAAMGADIFRRLLDDERA